MSRFSAYRGLSAIVAIVCLVGCEAAKSANPTAPTVAGPIPGVSITAPKPLEPGSGATLVAQSDPYTLLIENAGTSGSRAIWLQLEIAADSGFQQIVHQADNIQPGPNGRTSYKLPEPLGAGFTYYWRTRAADGANTGPYSAVSSFEVIVPVVIEPPAAVEPQGNITTNKPTFKVRNGAFSGTAGVVYRFHVGTTAEMTQTIAVVTVGMGSNGETTMTLGELPYSTVFYWRAYGTDGAKVSGDSQTLAFRTPAAPVAPPGGGGVPGGVPKGPGGRAADPAGGRLPLPGMSHIVQAVAQASPGALQNSCQSSGGNWSFMDQVVDTLRTYDTRWGYNGKRGNANDPSHDAIAYHYGGGPDANSTDVYIIDIVGGHCGSSPSPSWGDVTDATVNSGNVGRWISRGRF